MLQTPKTTTGAKRKEVTPDEEPLVDSDEEEEPVSPAAAARKALKFSDEHEECDKEGFEEDPNEGHPSTCIAQHWIPKCEVGSANKQMGAAIVTPTCPFMDKLPFVARLQRLH